MSTHKVALLRQQRGRRIERWLGIALGTGLVAIFLGAANAGLSGVTGGMWSDPDDPPADDALAPVEPFIPPSRDVWPATDDPGELWDGCLDQPWVTGMREESDAQRDAIRGRVAPAPTFLEQIRVVINADQAGTTDGGRTYTASGDVTVQQGDRWLGADRVELTAGRIDASGHLLYGDPALLWAADSGFLRLEDLTGSLDDTRYFLTETLSQGRADRVDMDGPDVLILTNGTYSTCSPASEVWRLRVSRLELDRSTGVGRAWHGRLAVLGVPIGYVPYMTFPIDDRRKTGLLQPTITDSSRSGREILLPYYINLAPNYDMTLFPRYMSERGVQLGAEVRYLQEHHRGTLRGSYLPDDDLTGTDRWELSLNQTTEPHPFLRSDISINRVGDEDVLRDFDSTFDLASVNHLRSDIRIRFQPDPLPTRVRCDQTGDVLSESQLQRCDALQTAQLAMLRADPARIFDVDPLALHGPETIRPPVVFLPEPERPWHWRNALDAELRADTYQTLVPQRPERTRPYERQPELTVRYRPDQVDINAVPIRFTTEGSAVNFTHPASDERDTATRLDLTPRLSLPYRRMAGFVEPALSVRHTSYSLSRAESTGPESIHRTLPVLSVDSGIFLDRFFGSEQRPLRQTLEPRAFYLFVPNTDQDDIPRFDTGRSSVRLSRLFAEDRFSGPDRVGDANQLALSVTSRLMDRNRGTELLAGEIGQVYYFSDREVTLNPGAAVEDRTSSELFGEGRIRLPGGFRVIGSAVYDPDVDLLRSFTGRIRYMPQDNARITGSYRFRQNLDGETTQELIDLETSWPLSPSWHVIAGWTYSSLEQETLGSIAGLQYQSCCWAVRMVNRVYRDEDDELDRSLLFQLELRGLGALGNSIEEYL